MMQAAYLRNRDNFTLRWCLHLTRRRRGAIQRQVWASEVIVLQVISEYAFQMRFVLDDHVVQTLAANTADDAFAIGILPGCTWCDSDLFNRQAFHAVLEVLAVGTPRRSGHVDAVSDV
jgi:hypothetical protein